MTKLKELFRCIFFFSNSARNGLLSGRSGCRPEVLGRCNSRRNGSTRHQNCRGQGLGIAGSQLAPIAGPDRNFVEHHNPSPKMVFLGNWFIDVIFQFALCRDRAANCLLIIAKNLYKHPQISHFLSKSAISQNSYPFHDLHAFVAKFCHCDLRTFSAKNLRLSSRLCQFFLIF